MNDDEDRFDDLSFRHPEDDSWLCDFIQWLVFTCSALGAGWLLAYWIVT